jgi:hypothetical protein
MSWNLDSYAPETEGLQAEREIFEDLIRSETEPHDGCEGCGATGRKLYHNEQQGIALCEPCDLAAEVQPVKFKRLRSGAWGITGAASYLQEGEQVVVDKRGGERTTVRVGRVLWSDSEQNRAIATIAR